MQQLDSRYVCDWVVAEIADEAKPGQLGFPLKTFREVFDGRAATR